MVFDTKQKLKLQREEADPSTASLRPSCILRSRVLFVCTAVSTYRRNSVNRGAHAQKLQPGVLQTPSRIIVFVNALMDAWMEWLDSP